jgi:hypothetical protein
MMQEDWMNKWVQESMARREREYQSCRVILTSLENSIASKQNLGIKPIQRLGLATAVANDLSVGHQEFKHDSKNAVAKRPDAKRHRLSMSILVVCIAVLSFVMGTVMTTPKDILSPSKPPAKVGYAVDRDPNQLYDDLQRKGVLVFRNLTFGTSYDIVSIYDITDVYLSDLINSRVNASISGKPVVFMLQSFLVRFEPLYEFKDYDYYKIALNGNSRFNVGGVPIFYSESLFSVVYLTFAHHGFEYFFKMSEVFLDGEIITQINAETVEILIKNLFGLTNTQL